MKAQELRLGNYVTHDQTDFFRIDEIIFTEHLGYCGVMYPSFPHLHQKITMSLSDAKPIDLVEEILVKCGFKLFRKRIVDDANEEYEVCVNEYYILDESLLFRAEPLSSPEFYNVYVHVDSNNYGRRLKGLYFPTPNYGEPDVHHDFDDTEVIEGYIPKYLHELQNLYFVLSGKELEIKL